MHIITGKPAAVAHIRGGKEAVGLRGAVWFYQVPAGVLVEVKVRGLPQNGYGIYGMHIHEGGSCKGIDFSASGKHYNPSALPHPSHAGDLPPLISYGGRAYATCITDRFSIKEIIGRTIVIHGKPDDFHTQPSGNSGDKIACGVIEKAM